MGYRNRRRKGVEDRRRTAIIFAIVLGWCGVHRFTLGQWQYGLLHIFLMIVSFATIGEWVPFEMTPWTTLSAALAYFHAWQWWQMSDEAFAERYLEPVEEPVKGKYLKGHAKESPRVLSQRARKQALAAAHEAYAGHDYEEAATLYEKAVGMDLSDGESRVFAARCYSLLEDEEAAYRHLERAYVLKATNLHLVDEDDAFAWLRTRIDFQERRRKGYGRSSAEEAMEDTADYEKETWRYRRKENSTNKGLPEPRANILDQVDLKQKLASLRDLYDSGLIEESEYTRIRERLLHH